MKLDEIARLAGVSRTTASYVINGKAKQYRVSDKTVEKVMAVVREHNYHPNAVAAGLRAGRTRSIGLVIPDLENTSYTRIANYLERQARQRGYQLLIACSEDQPDNEMRCIEHLYSVRLMPLLFRRRCHLSILFINAGLTTRSRLSRWTAPSIVNTSPAWLVPIRMMPKCWRKSYVSFPPRRCFILARCRSFLSASCVNKASVLPGKMIRAKCISFMPTAMSVEAAAQLFEKWLETHPMPQALFTTSFALLQGVMDVTLRRDGKLPSDLAIATFGDNELLDFLQCPVLAVAQRHRDVAERVLEIVLASLDEPRKPKPGLTRIKRNLYRRGVLSRS